MGFKEVLLITFIVLFCLIIAILLIGGTAMRSKYEIDTDPHNVGWNLQITAYILLSIISCICFFSFIYYRQDILVVKTRVIHI